MPCSSPPQAVSAPDGNAARLHSPHPLDLDPSPLLGILLRPFFEFCPANPSTKPLWVACFLSLQQAQILILSPSLALAVSSPTRLSRPRHVALHFPPSSRHPWQGLSRLQSCLTAPATVPTFVRAWASCFDRTREQGSAHARMSQIMIESTHMEVEKRSPWGTIEHCPSCLPSSCTQLSGLQSLSRLFNTHTN